MTSKQVVICDHCEKVKGKIWPWYKLIYGDHKYEYDLCSAKCVIDLVTSFMVNKKLEQDMKNEQSHR